MNDIASKLTKIAESEKKALELNKHLENAIYGTEYGGKSEYDRFWDSFQENGNRTDYYAAFRRWNRDIFKPKYDLRPTDGYMLLGFFEYQKEDGLDLVEHLKEIGITLDFSASTSAQYLFWYSSLKRVGEINTSSAYRLDSAFYNCTNLETIDKLILRRNSVASQLCGNNVFYNCGNLQNIIIEGDIQDIINFQWSPKLTTASLLSILTALSKNSSVASGKSITFSTVHEAVIEADTACKEQYDLATAAGWTIAFA